MPKSRLKQTLLTTSVRISSLGYAQNTGKERTGNASPYLPLCKAYATSHFTIEHSVFSNRFESRVWPGLLMLWTVCTPSRANANYSRVWQCSGRFAGRVWPGLPMLWTVCTPSRASYSRVWQCSGRFACKSCPCLTGCVNALGGLQAGSGRVCPGLGML